ncbi:MAG: hypothetical protein PHP59_06775 [Methanofollis sp.]|uniref:hypothetical protein n=1 Tax=Methanofollis sp. TaxID=2052835 RepID=UPI00260D0C65|nr:hypothetical protein [Methanofollis sp.]MDD4255066.1 hypothetical protein [Methanofollis sp.]
MVEDTSPESVVSLPPAVFASRGYDPALGVERSTVLAAVVVVTSTLSRSTRSR